ncbi:hypothetical protein J437_LFUL016821 [Ladona fulva]|uniref:Charged multivesicular body protein 7 n=1 Tax=Ladona fulva TaxID=123851 RepID=A0A8K0KJU1_LADFU|nr:hypothetical protein J437_LFUL016821 [Ladona fulva]
MENNPKVTEDFLPDCWKDDVRMNSLFAPFRKRSANPQDWDSKLTFWKTLIEKWCFSNKKPVITVSEVSAAFERNGKRALCLPEVVSEILRSGEGCRLCDLESEHHGSWSNWAIQMMVKRPFQWAAGQLWATNQMSSDEPIVLLSVLKSLSEKMLSRCASSLVDVEELQREEENARLALVLLRRRGLAAFATCGRRTLVKLGDGGTVGEVERATFMLGEDEKMVRQSIERMEEEKLRLTCEAKEYLRKGMRQLAKSSLRKRHAVEKHIEKRVEALDNIQTLLQRVKETETDAQVLESYRSGVIALKKTLAEGGLSVESAESAKADLEDVLELHEDISSSLSNVGKISAAEEQELEEELSELLGESTVEENPTTTEGLKDISNRLNTMKLEDLPNVPTHVLSQPVILKVPSQ